MVVILIVSWNVRDLLRACLLSLERYPATTHEQRIIVVDNASTDGSADMVRRDFPGVHLIANATNRGFTGGNNDGLTHIRERWAVGRAQSADKPAHTSQPTAHVLLLNPDAEVTPGALDAMLAYADAHPDVGVIGPQLRYPDGSVQSSKRHFPTLATTIFESTWLQNYAPRRVSDYYYARELRDDQTGDVDWVVGAAMLVRREVIEKVGGLDERTFFMYSEEMDWCKRIKDAGWRVVYLPQAVVIHHEAKSSSQASAQRIINFNTSKVRYLAKHHGRAQAAFARFALLGLLRWEWLIEGGKWLLGHKRPLRAERIRIYSQALRSRFK
jgi:hypothetical protein